MKGRRPIVQGVLSPFEKGLPARSRFGEGRGIKGVSLARNEGSLRGASPSLFISPSFPKGFVSKVVIPVKTGIQIDIIRHEFWIPTCVGMTKKLKNGTYNTSPSICV